MTITEKSVDTILIVDDVPSNLNMLVAVLKDRGYSIRCANNGLEALNSVNEFIPDLILLDIMMPGINGLDVCRKLKAEKRTRNIPVMFVTAKAETSDMSEVLAAGAVDYVTKPFAKAELVARVSTHMKLRRAQKDIIELEQRNAVAAMVITANHEINQPLTVLQGNFEVLENTLDKNKLTDKQYKSIEKVNESINKIHKTLEKYRKCDSIDFDTYLKSIKMVTFNQT
ncbi:MAG: response regulator [bacterium]|nr:response regulator [bacterium]